MKTVLFLCAFLYSFSAYGDFLPPNDLYLQDNLEADSGITEEDFNAAIDEAIAFYAPVIVGHEAELKVNRLWDNSTVNASASQSGTTWTVNMYGGLARREEVTKDGFALVLCHELGHHLGGFPFVFDWAANEGQSDYFSTLSCARQLWSDDEEKNLKAGEAIGDYPRQLCDDAFFGAAQNKINVCYRSMLGGLSLANLLGALGGSDAVSVGTPDIKVLAKTNGRHPAAQCRLDTYVSGALCQSDFDFSLIPETEASSALNTCHRSSGYRHGLRPRCWFHPASSKL